MVAVLQVDAHVLHVPARQINRASFRGDRARIQRYVVGHRHGLLLEEPRLELVELHALLVPLEGVEALGQLRPEAAFDVVVDAQIALNHVIEVTDDLVGVLVEQALQFRHFFVVVEVFLVLGVQLNENRLEVLQRLNELLRAALLCQVGGLLQLSILLLQPVVEVRQLVLHVLLDVLLLVPHDLKYLVFEFEFALDLEFLEFVEHRVHERRQNAHVLGGHLFTLPDVVLDEAELLFKVVQSENRLGNFLSLALKLLNLSVVEAEELRAGHGLLDVRLLLEKRLLRAYLFLNAFRAKRLLAKHHDRLREVHLTQVHLHCV